MRVIILYIVCISAALHGQVRCDYQPIDFGAVTPVWNRVIIDSSMIGYSYSNELRSDSIADGMEHFSRIDEGHSFVSGDFLYSIQTVLIAGDAVGYYIEQINIETGVKLWSTSIDSRNRDYMYKIYDAWVQDSLLIVKGGRRVTQFATTFVNISGGAPLYPMIQTFDLSNGTLIEEYVADSTAVDNPLITTTIRVRGEYAFVDEEGWRLVDYGILNADGRGRLLLYQSDSLGNTEIAGDTLLWGGDFLNDWSPDTSGKYTVDPIAYNASRGAYAFVQQRARRYEGVGPPSAATVTLFDDEWNALRKLDLTDILPDNFGSIDVMSFTDDRLVIRCCANFNPNQGCENWFVLLDDDLNIIKAVDARRNFNSPIANPVLDESDNLYISARERVADDVFITAVYRDNEDGLIDLVASGSFASDFIRSPNPGKVFLLDDGDLLFNVYQSCTYDPSTSSGIAKSTFPEWFRIDAADLALPVSVGEVTSGIDGRVYPNPVVDYVNIDFGDYVTGMTYLYDNNGALLDQRYLEDVSMVTYDMSIYSTGIYQVQVVGEDGRIWTERLVKIQ